MKVKVHFDDLPKGAEVYVHGLGALHNGEEYALDAEQTAFWKAMNNVAKVPSTLVLSTTRQTVVEHTNPDLPETMQPREVDDPTEDIPQSVDTPVVNQDPVPVDAGNKEGKK